MFIASLPVLSDVNFVDDVSLDLRSVEVKEILHVLHIATRFSSAVFLDSYNERYGQTVNGIWLAILDMWCMWYNCIET